MRMYNLLSPPFSLSACIILAMNALGAPTSCNYACHPLDESGHQLISSPYALAYDRAFSIFDCVYYTTGSAEAPQTCHYSKDTGLLTAGSAVASKCPPAALKCADTPTPKFSAIDNPEQPIWVIKGNNELWLKMNPPDAKPNN